MIVPENFWVLEAAMATRLLSYKRIYFFSGQLTWILTICSYNLVAFLIASHFYIDDPLRKRLLSEKWRSVAAEAGMEKKYGTRKWEKNTSEWPK